MPLKFTDHTNYWPEIANEKSPIKVDGWRGFRSKYTDGWIVGQSKKVKDAH